MLVKNFILVAHFVRVKIPIFDTQEQIVETFYSYYNSFYYIKIIYFYLEIEWNPHAEDDIANDTEIDTNVS